MKVYSNITFQMMTLFMVASLLPKSLIIPTQAQAEIQAQAQAQTQNAVEFELPQANFQCANDKTRTINYKAQYNVLSLSNNHPINYINYINYNFEMDYNNGEYVDLYSGSIHGALHGTITSSYTFDHDGIYDVRNTRSIVAVFSNGDTWPSEVLTTIRRFEIRGDSCVEVDIMDDTEESLSQSHQEESPVMGCTTTTSTGTNSNTTSTKLIPESNQSLKLARKMKETPISSSSKVAMYNMSLLFMTMIFFWCY
jgi:hypothetical protein